MSKFAVSFSLYASLSIVEKIGTYRTEKIREKKKEANYFLIQNRRAKRIGMKKIINLLTDSIRLLKPVS